MDYRIRLLKRRDAFIENPISKPFEGHIVIDGQYFSWKSSVASKGIQDLFGLKIEYSNAFNSSSYLQYFEIPWKALLAEYLQQSTLDGII